MSFSIFSGIKQCISNLVFGRGQKRGLETKNQDGEPSHKTAKMSEDSETLNSILKKEKLKLDAESGKKQEEETKSLKMEIQTDKSEIEELCEKNLKLMDILHQTEKNIEGIIEKPTQILEVTRNRIQDIMASLSKLVAEKPNSSSNLEQQHSNNLENSATSDCTDINSPNSTPTAAAISEIETAEQKSTTNTATNSTETTRPTTTAAEGRTEAENEAPTTVATTRATTDATAEPPTAEPADAIATTTAGATSESESGSRQIIPEVLDENLKFANIKGLDEQIKFLRQNLFIHLVNKEILLQCGVEPVRGFVFYGTETVDMALLAKTMTVELSRLVGKKYNFFQRHRTDVFEKYSKESDKYVISLFDKAIAMKPSVVYLEDVPSLYHWCSLLGPYGKTHIVINEAMNLVKSLDLIVIATTDKEKKIAPVLLGAGRLEKSIAFTSPSKERRLYVLEAFCSKWKQPPSLEILEDMAKKAENLSMEELEKLCSQSFLSAIQRKLATIEKERCTHCQTGDNLKIAASTLESVEVLLEDWNSALGDITKAKAGLKQSSNSLLGSLISSKPKESEETKITEENPGFSSVGGLDQLIQNLRENIMFPLANKTALLDWGVEPVKGIIFHGPPGTGKTLLAKALAVELSRLGDQAFTFFYHKGTDCHNMYIGETGKNLRNIFAQAVAKKPAIIFFDEIDGLCSARTEGSASSTFYNGVVTTMLGLMDSIKRGEVIVIAATNRIDSLDPALRRPGRFDKAIEFFPPKEEGRRAILKIHSSKWKGGCSEEILEEISKITVGYTGADLEHLCRQTFLLALKRKFPDMKIEADCKMGSEKDELLKDLDIILQDWYAAMKSVKGSNSSVFGNSITSVKSIPPGVSKLLSGINEEILKKIEPFVKNPQKSKPITAEKGCGINSFLIWDTGDRQAQIIDNFLIPSLLTSTELKDAVSFTLCDPSKLSSLVSQLLSCSNPAILYVPRMDKLQIQMTLAGECSPGENIHRPSLLEQIEALRGENILLLATAACSISQLPEDFRLLFKGMPDSREYKLRKLESGECRGFFEPIFQERYPQLLEKVENITANANLYDLLDLKAELSRTCVSGIEQDLRQSQVALNLQRILDEFKINKLDQFTPHNHMYT